jgi:hypothetical protein
MTPERNQLREAQIPDLYKPVLVLCSDSTVSAIGISSYGSNYISNTSKDPNMATSSLSMSSGFLFSTTV